ncbi:MAG: phage integrase N-terminal SAM-like domain-containing protein [Candidatus Omnitrophica bacterium]|nr:phage integrase N-terminal SAM-like domain-containing protein [Candidatus Omnitrophota bacterium]
MREKSRPTEEQERGGPPVDWAAKWVRKFQVYRERRYGASGEASREQAEAFLGFIVERWQAAPWQQEQARTALKEWLGPVVREEPKPVAPEAERTVLRGSEAAVPGGPGSAGSGKWGLAEGVLRLQGAIRLKHYSQRTEETYVHWLRQYWRFLQGHKAVAGFAELASEAKVKRFLEYLAIDRKVSAATQNQALNALVFFYREARGEPLGQLGEVLRAKASKRLPVVITAEQTRAMLGTMEGESQLKARLLYGTGMRLMELLRLRVKDLDFDRNVITVRAGEGNKDRVTMLPAALKEPLRQHLGKGRQQHQADLQEGLGRARYG